MVERSGDSSSWPIWRCGVLLAAVLPLAGCPLPPSTPTPEDYRTVRAATVEGQYHIYVPSYYSSDRAWPLVVTLHGTNPWDTYTLQIKEWDALAEREGFIVVAPKLKSPQGVLPRVRKYWYEHLREDEQLILSVVDEVSGNYSVDRRAVLLTGFSAGGYPLYWTGLRHPDVFNMLIARACNSDVEMFEKIEVTKEAQKLPIRIFWGRDDLAKIRRESWSALAWLRNHYYLKADREEVAGGHRRMPERAYQLWRPHLPRELK